MENIQRKETFVDGVNQIHYLGNMIRFDFVSLTPKDEQNKKTDIQLIERVVMTPQSFINMFSSMQQLVDKLVQNGVLGASPQQKAQDKKKE